MTWTRLDICLRNDTDVTGKRLRYFDGGACTYTVTSTKGHNIELDDGGAFIHHLATGFYEVEL
jgi:hypothetical protein